MLALTSQDKNDLFTFLWDFLLWWLCFVHVFLLLDHKFLESRGGISYELVKSFE